MAELHLPDIRDRPTRETILDATRFLFGQLVEEGDLPGGFLGTMPMTLSRRHWAMIHRNDYVFLEKSDGVRYLLFAFDGHCYLIDRRSSIFWITPDPAMILPMPGGRIQRHHMTLLDGELCFNLLYRTWEYLIYDAIAINGDIVGKWKDYRKRLSAANQWVVVPRSHRSECSGGLRIRIKDFFEKEAVKNLFDRVTKDEKGEYVYTNHDRIDGSICNHNDGAIIAPVILAYPIKTCEALLKWKPPHLNSVDFRLTLEKIEEPQRGPTVNAYIGYQGDQGRTIRLRKVIFPSATRQEWYESFDRYHDSIIECSYDRQAGEWRYIRQRDDKNTPNFSSTVIDTLESIAENITKPEFIDRASQGGGTVVPPAKRARLDMTAHDFHDDLFGSDNEQYIQTTPITRTLPPAFGNGPPGGDLSDIVGDPR